MLEILAPAIVEKRLASSAVDRLALEKNARHEVHLIAMRAQDLVGAVVRFLHDARNLIVDAARRLLGVILRVAVIAAEEHLVVGLAEHLRAERRGHAVLRHHRARHLRRTLEVVARARGHVVAEDFLRHTAAHEDRQLVEHLAHGIQYLVLLGDGQGVAERATTGDD